ncbi:MAG: iron chelate uptake ABC transporter family permease subunit, partial [Brevibacterium aurantiacum]
MRRSTHVRLAWMLAALAVVAVLMILSTMIGSRNVGLDDVLAAYGGSAAGFDQAAVAKRIPRTLLAVCVGAALGISGAVMQGVTRNPLADPGILGVNTGASLAVVIGIAFFGLSTADGYIWFAIVGATLTAVFVYA